MLSARRSPSISHRSLCSSILQSSFTCTFLLPSFFPSGGVASRGKRYVCGSARLFSSPSSARPRYTQYPRPTKIPPITLNGTTRARPNPPLIHNHAFSTSPLPTAPFTENPEWLTNISIAFPERPPEAKPKRKDTSNSDTETPRDPRLKRFHLHGDLIHDGKFPTLFGFTVPPKPPLKNPRYEKAWISKLLSGPFLPVQLRDGNDISEEEPDKEKLLLFLERAGGHKHDLLTELLAEGKWKHVVWIVQMLLEPGFEYPDDIKMQTVFEGVRYTTLGEEDYRTTKSDPDAGIPSPAIAGRSGLWAVGDQRVKWDIERRRRGFGIVLSGLAGMVLRAGEPTNDGKVNRLGNHHTDLLPTVRQILAYLHTSSFIPDALYTVGRHPRLYMLQSRILASLADAVWRAQEAMVAEEAAGLGFVGEYRGFEVPRARYRLEVWGGGTTEISERPSVESLEQAGKSAEQIRQIEWGTYAEREVWLELILTIIVETGYGSAGVNVIKMINSASSKNNSWKFIDYISLHPTEYTRPAVEMLLREPKTGVAAQWGLEGHSLAPPPVTTHHLSLPDWILPGVADALVDSTAEGRGLEAMFMTILSYAKALPMRKETMLRLLRHPALIWSKNAEVMEVGAGLLWEFGDQIKACSMYYTALTLHRNNQNLPGAMRVWEQIQKTQNVMPIPKTVVGRYLKFLVSNRRLGYAWTMLQPTPDPEIEGTMLPPVIPESTYTSPVLAPPLLALAVESESKGLYEAVSGAIKNAHRNHSRIVRGTWTSLINAQLAFGDLEAAKKSLTHMIESRIQPDGVVIAVLVQRELQRDLEAGYRFVESGIGIIPFSPHTPEPQEEESHTEDKTPPPPPSSSQVYISRDAWVAVLSAAVAHTDYDRTRWALENMRIDLQSGSGLDTTTFNILLKGVAERQGSFKAMEMCHRHHTRGKKRLDGEIIGNGISFRTVLHAAVREQIRIDSEEERDAWSKGKWWNPQWGRKPVPLQIPKKKKKIPQWIVDRLASEKRELEERAHKRKEDRKRSEAVIEWCWNECRGSGIQILDLERVVRIWLNKSPKPYSGFVR